MTKATLEDYTKARETIGEDALTKSGYPKMDNINAALHAVGLDPIDGDAREAFEEKSFVAKLEDAPDGMVTIELISASTDPVPLYVHGVGSFNLRVGQKHRIPEEAVTALEASDAKFTEVED